MIRKKFQVLKEGMSEESRARTEMRAEELLADKGSVTVHDLVSEMEVSFAEAQERAVAEGGDVPPTSEDELEKLVGEARSSARTRS